MFHGTLIHLIYQHRIAMPTPGSRVVPMWPPFFNSIRLYLPGYKRQSATLVSVIKSSLMRAR